MFIIKKTIPLDFFGEGWQKAYVELTPFSFEENAELLKIRRELGNIEAGIDADIDGLSQKIMDLIKSKFIAGMGFNGKELEPITKENIGSLPMEAISKILLSLQGVGGIDPKDPTP